ncbi:MAG: NAD-dependent epimerase/dehydratase family protein [Limisphaerales bacterium]
MRILVTGAAGFIGAHLVNRLFSTHDIVALDNMHRGCSRDSLPSSVDFHTADVRDRRAVRDAVRGCDIVFHLAAQSNVLGAVADSSYAFTTNVVGTHVVLEAAAIAGVKRLVFTSSREIYGDPRSIPVRETARLRPKNAYGASKLAGEVYCELATRQRLETVVLRLANVYGPNDRDRVIPLFIAAASAGEPITVFGNQKILDFVWIDTVVDALIQSGFGPFIRGPVNVGSGKETTILDLARRIIKLTKSSSTIKVVEEREQEVGRFVAEITRGKRLLRLPESEDPLWALAQML